MPVTEAENDKYRTFVSNIAKRVGLFDYNGNDIIWHYTDGAGLLGIIQSGAIYATQVASLNDKNETTYATDLFKTSLQKLAEAKKADPTATAFINGVFDYLKEDPTSPTHGTSKFFVVCFSGEEDDLPQWDRYGKKNQYAIGFYARGFWREPTSTIYKVLYDRIVQERIIDELVEATLAFYLEGLTEERQADPKKWGMDFFEAWDEWIYKLAPLAKAPKWKAENEFRLVHELKTSEFSEIRFTQKETMIARYLPLKTPSWVKDRTPRLPIAKITIGPGNNVPVTRVSIALLLEQLGYTNVEIKASEVALQRP